MMGIIFSQVWNAAHWFMTIRDDDGMINNAQL